MNCRHHTARAKLADWHERGETMGTLESLHRACQHSAASKNFPPELLEVEIVDRDITFFFDSATNVSELFYFCFDDVILRLRNSGGCDDKLTSNQTRLSAAFFVKAVCARSSICRHGSSVFSSDKCCVWEWSVYGSGRVHTETRHQVELQSLALPDYVGLIDEAAVRRKTTDDHYSIQLANVVER